MLGNINNTNHDHANCTYMCVCVFAHTYTIKVS